MVGTARREQMRGRALGMVALEGSMGSVEQRISHDERGGSCVGDDGSMLWRGESRDMVETTERRQMEQAQKRRRPTPREGDARGDSGRREGQAVSRRGSPTKGGKRGGVRRGSGERRGRGQKVRGRW